MSDPKEQVERVRSQFTRQADAYARLRQTTDEKGLQALVAISGADETSRVLDVACGPGFLTMAFAAGCASATGFDATDAFLAMARDEAKRRGLENLEFHHGEAEALPFEDGAFDVVSCRAAFHHFAQPALVLAEMTRVVTPEGRLLVADMLGSEDLEKARAHDEIERLCDPSHARAIPASEFASMFTTAGLEVVLAPESELSYELEEWMDHGGPDEDAAREIRGRMEASLEGDRTGLAAQVKGEGAERRIHFRHRAAAFVLTPVRGRA